MTDTLTDLEKQVMASIQEDIPITERPYRHMAENLGLTEERMIEVLESLCRRGIIRRFGATLRHQKSGFQANAMTAWQVDEDRIQEVGQMMAASPHVSHCYRRNPAQDWPYNLYTMIHAPDEATCHAIAGELAERTGVQSYSLLFSRRELKKTSMKYFSEDEEA
jgi:DNA-binding Lrp family transcriptional regulator